MADRALESTTLVHRLTLITLSRLDRADETPSHAGDITRACDDHLDAVGADVVGGVSEADVSRALNELDADGLVAGDAASGSPVGKGRPTYEPQFDAAALRDAFGDDDRLEGVLDRLDR
ncbi:hypothetical protein [Haloplanus halobius]|uniref:hypothetical protein n=1 Tax=Haloplanus halobius TaxID=2934938 RepID=UPI00200FF59C|nr:hypothetical protein [Haloplanus sp. XH21]